VAQTACDHDPVKVTGKALVGAPAGAVWAMLGDPGVLAQAIPGCQSLDVTGPGRCAATVAIAIAAVSGTYAGDAQIRGRREPSMIAAAVSAAGARGSVAADVTVLLAPAGGGTEVGYEIDARVSGPIAAAGQLVLAAIAKRLAGEFLAGLDAAAAAKGSSGLVAGDKARGETGPARPTRPDGELVPRAGRDVPAGVVSVLAGTAIGVAGIVIGAVLGRRGGRARRRGPG